MNKHLKRLLTFVLVLALALVPVFSVSAAPAATQTGEAKITKRLTTTGDQVLIPNYTFEFTVTPVSVDGVAYAAGNMPAEYDKSLTFTSSYSWTAPVLPAVYYTADEEVDLVGGVTWPHAGEYIYTVVEKNFAYTDVSKSQAQYTMIVQVKNTGVPATPLEVTNVAFQQTMQDDGTANPASPPTKTEPIFVNHYTAKADLLITLDDIVGDYANLTQKFTYTINFDLAPGETGPYSGDITINGSTSPVTSIASGYSFDLGLKDKLVIKDLPVGTKYTITQSATAPLKYKAQAEVTTTNQGSAATWNSDTGAEGAAMTIGTGGAHVETNLNAAIAIVSGAGNNVAEWTNTLADPPAPTGILIDTLPFILLILAGVGGLVAFIVVKRRRSH